MSYTINSLLDIDNFLAYSTDTNPTTNDDMQEYMTNQNTVVKALVGSGGLWQPNVVYNKNTVVWSPNMQPNTLAIVISEGGTSGSTEPSWTASGSTVTDGSITYSIRPKIVASSDIMADVLLAAHPVGSYYWSSKNTSPATLFGGKWSAVTDKFVLAAGDTYKVDTTGGASEVTLTVDQMPSHSHSASADTQGNHTHSASADSQGNHAHNMDTWIHTGSGSGANVSRLYQTTTSENPGVYTTNSAGAHSHNISVVANGAHSHNISIGNNGSSQAHENMPPYIVAYCWCRTA
jgi:microcystin-dependent protein